MQLTKSVRPSIGLAEIFPPEAIVVGLEARTKQGVIGELVHHLVGLGHLAASEEKTVVQSILARERLSSTALYNGIALPHCRTNVTEKFRGVLGLDPRGIPFDSMDGELVHTIFLLLAPLEGREQHYDILGRITAIGFNKSQQLQLRGCQTADAACHFLQELDRK